MHRAKVLAPLHECVRVCTCARLQSMHSGKVMVLEQLLRTVRGHSVGDKVVVVSNYTEALDVLTKVWGVARRTCAVMPVPCLVQLAVVSCLCCVRLCSAHERHQIMGTAHARTGSADAAALLACLQMCDRNRWPSLRLDGSCSVAKRQPLVDRFNSPQVSAPCAL